MKCTTKCLTEDFTSFRLIIIHHKTRVCYPKVYYPSRYHKLWVCFGLQDKDYRASLTSAPDFQFFLKHFVMDYVAQQCLKLNFSALLELSRWAWDLRTQLSFYKVDKISFFLKLALEYSFVFLSCCVLYYLLLGVISPKRYYYNDLFSQKQTSYHMIKDNSFLSSGWRAWKSLALCEMSHTFLHRVTS